MLGRRLIHLTTWLLWLIILIATFGVAFVAHSRLERRDQLVEAVMREGMAFVNDSAVHDVDEQLEITRQVRDGAIGVSAFVLILPLLWRLLPAVRKHAGEGGPAETH